MPDIREVHILNSTTATVPINQSDAFSLPNYPRIIARINLSKHAFIKTSRLSLHFSFDTSIGRHFVSFLICISCFYIYLVKHFNLNEKFILLKDSSDRIGIRYHNLDRIRIRQFRIGF